MVTYNDVRQGVFARLQQKFPEVARYGEEIKQGLKPPCFFVKLFPGQQDREVGRRYIRYHSFDIHYFAMDDRNEAMHAMAEQLYDVMEYIIINGNLTRGRSMRHEIVDRVLHFFVDYDFHVMRSAPDEPLMEELEQKERLK
ncbi:hypothetical protein DUZ99_02010 [Xylanibacillus composti]|uniref:Phage protein n=1 Tax=Xylanibacillus composti TaxID=1572762 RepID=A0A8J4M4K4_9BACL|nr:hypothetical protein [Xylanibacillus composti]MDT9723769.1 hypothetical protein [Xylanibacillus composti]GIQ70761.1 hypothetical protein XYCOK13_35850 [Xylanibacillus composti]